MHHPKISIITVVFNDYQNIEQTILSVINQTYDNVEYVIIDGGSKDGTLDVIKKYSDSLARWKSEPDNGVYDAMNKGLDLVTGDFVNFMNSGDTFYSNTTIEDFVNAIRSENVDVYYGDVMMIYKSIGNRIRRFNNVAQDTLGTDLCHQSTFSNVDLMKRYKFDTSFRIAADINFFTQILRKEGAVFEYIPIIIANYEAENGLSAKNLRLMYQEYMRVYSYKKFSFKRIKTGLLMQLKVVYYRLPTGIRAFLHKQRMNKLYGQ